MRSEKQLRDFWASRLNQTAYIDITGLDHSVWAALLNSAVRFNISVKCVYVEPRDYQTINEPHFQGEIFDLSEKIRGVSPLPGFISLFSYRDEDIRFVPMLGFEGPRLSYLINKLDPFREKITPIIGVPGFRLDYPFHTFNGNHKPLIDERIWKNIQYATANCPFTSFYLLRDIARKHPGDLLKIAPIGTKPHALGAVLFAIAAAREKVPVELVYDHPIRKSGRSKGMSQLLIYDVSMFMSNPLLLSI